MSVSPINPQDDNLDRAARQAGWTKNFEVSGGGHNSVRVPGAPPLGGNPAGGLLYFGNYTAPDGRTIYMRTNMDRSQTVTLYSPLGAIIEHFTCKTMSEACSRTIDLGIL